MPREVACRHFQAPIRHETCKAHVTYASFGETKIEVFQKAPCLDPNKPGAKSCPLYEPYTESEIKAQNDEFEQMYRSTVQLKMKVLETGLSKGQVTCPRCGTGIVHFAIVGPRKHMHARCETDGCLSVME